MIDKSRDFRWICRPEQIAAALGLWLGMAIANRTFPDFPQRSAPVDLTTRLAMSSGVDCNPADTRSLAVESLAVGSTRGIWVSIVPLQKQIILLALPERNTTDKSAVEVSETP